MDTTFSMLPEYAELFAFSNFTFLHGASRGEELVMRAIQLGYKPPMIAKACDDALKVTAEDFNGVLRDGR